MVKKTKVFFKFTFLALGLLLSQLAVGQALNLNQDPAAFIEDLNKQLAKNVNAFNRASLSGFETAYTTVNATDKPVLITCLTGFSKRGYKPNELLIVAQTIGSFASLKNSSMTVPEFTTALQNTCLPLTAKNGIDIVYQLEKFLRSGFLYSSNFNQTKIPLENLNFKYLSTATDIFTNVASATPAGADVTKTEDEDFGWGENKKEETYDSWDDPSLVVSQNPVNNKEIVKIPKLQGLAVYFDNIDLNLIGPSDSITIKNTSGAYAFNSYLLVAEKGKINWYAAQREAKATLKKYYLKNTQNKLVADQVLLDHDQILKAPVEGVLELKLERRPQNQVSTYPRFKSYENDVKLNLFSEAIDYSGGYTLTGNKLSSTSLFGKHASLVANKKSKNSFLVISREFFFTDTSIVSPLVSFKTRIDKDSVTHQAVKMEYLVLKKHLQLNKLDRGVFRNSMYSDSFHQVDIKSDAMSWNLESGKMDFYIISAKTEVPAVFESFDYFNPERIRSLSAASSFNPLITAGNIVARKKKNEFSSEDIMAVTKKEAYMVNNGILIAHAMGFFEYNQAKNLYSLSRKGEHYFLSFLGKKDFDDLVLTSLSSDKNTQRNASIDLTDKSLDIKGTQDFKLSDSLGISFVPKDQSMKIIGNKVFSFNGLIAVKNFKFYGDFEVEYEKFLVKLKRIDSILFTPLADYKKGNKNTIGTRYLYGNTGMLYLNSPDNKSGRKKLIEFPKLEIPGGVLVYFNDPIRNQKFSNEINFKSTAIKLDSLNAVDPVYDGTFTLGNMLKPIKDRLMVMGDSTMGMSHKPLTAYNLYNTASTLKADGPIQLSRKGLLAKGDINHIVSVLKAEKLTFSEDHLLGSGSSGTITETIKTNVYFPQVAVQDYNFFWQPELDSMSINSDKGFTFYANSTSLKGNLLLKQKGLFGGGELNRTDATFTSLRYQFKQPGFTADAANFNVKAETADAKPVFSGKNIDVDFNVKTSIVNFSSLSNSDFNTATVSQLAFPYSNYNTTIEKAIWDIKSKLISMKGDLDKSYFTSTLANQYGLRFKGTEALYTISSNILDIKGVDEIRSADAAIIPPGGKVLVNPQGLVEPFEKAKIIADTLNRYHTLTNASVKINSKISFTGTADYQFVNVSADTFNIKISSFEFAEILPDGSLNPSKASNKLNMIARAKIAEKDSLYLSPRMLYKGEMVMYSPFKNLSLNGLVLPDLKNYPLFGGSWITYKGNKSEAISINIDETLRDGGKPLHVGLHLHESAQSNALYPTFLSFKSKADDGDVFTGKGLFKREEEFKRFRISPADSLQTGNTFDFYDKTGIIALDGSFNLLGAPTKVMETVGQAEIKLDSNLYNFYTMAKFDFAMPIPMIQKMGQNIVKGNLDAGNSEAAIKPEDEDFMAKISQLIGKKEALTYQTKNRKEYLPLFKQSDSFLKALVLTDLNLKWYPKANAYVSQGKIGLSNMGDVDINAQVPGLVEIAKSPATGDELNIYLEVTPTLWYFFKYSGGQLSITSSDEDLNKMLSGPGPDAKEKKSDAKVTFMDSDMAVRYRKRFLETYLGLKETAKKTGQIPALNVPGTKKPVKKEEEKEGF